MSTPVTFDFDLRIHPLVAIKKAAYRFSAHYLVEIIPTGDVAVRVQLTRHHNPPAWDCDAERFPAEVLDQELRETVADETKGVRDLLLAHAFSGLALIDPTGDSADFREDPLNICQSRTSAG